MSFTKVINTLESVFQRTLGATYPAPGVVVPRGAAVQHAYESRTATAPAQATTTRSTSAVPTATGTLRIA